MFVRRSEYDRQVRENLELKLAALELQAKYEELKRGMDEIAKLLDMKPAPIPQQSQSGVIIPFIKR